MKNTPSNDGTEDGQQGECAEPEQLAAFEQRLQGFDLVLLVVSATRFRSAGIGRGVASRQAAEQGEAGESVKQAGVVDFAAEFPERLLELVEALHEIPRQRKAQGDEAQGNPFDQANRVIDDRDRCTMGRLAVAVAKLVRQVGDKNA